MSKTKDESVENVGCNRANIWPGTVASEFATELRAVADALRVAMSALRDGLRDLLSDPGARKQLHESAAKEARTALVKSQRWMDAVKGLDVLAMATSGTVDLDALTLGELLDVTLWAEGDDMEMPSVLAEYIERVRGAS